MELDWCLPASMLAVCLVVVYKLVIQPRIEKARKRERLTRQREQARIDAHTSLPGFKWNRRYLDRVSKSGIALDRKRGKLCVFGFGEHPNSWHMVLGGEDILRVEIIENGESVMTTTPKHTVGNAVVGGLLFGGTGAVVGAMSSKSETTVAEKVRNLSLRLLVDDLEQPTYQVSFLSESCSRDSERYQDAARAILYYHSAIEVLIQRSDNHSDSSNSAVSSYSEDLAAPRETPSLARKPQEARLPGTSAIQATEPVPKASTKRVSEEAGAPAADQEVLSMAIESLDQIRRHILTGQGQIRETESGATLSWKPPAQASDRELCIAIEVLDGAEVAINGTRYPASLDGIRRGVAQTYRML